MNKIKEENTAKYENDVICQEIVERYYSSLLEFLSCFDFFFFFNEKYVYAETQYKLDYVFSFTFLKIIDGALTSSKKNDLNNEDNTYVDSNKSIYPSGESLCFSNNSEWDLKSLVFEHLEYENISELNKFLYDHLMEYVGGFNNSVQEILYGFKFYESIDFLKENDLLLHFLAGLYLVDLNISVFESSKNLQEFYLSFIKYFRNKKIFSLGGYSYFFSFSERPNLSFSLLPKLLFSGVNIKEKEEISIFDSACEEGDLLLECYDFIHKINPNCRVKLYGCSSNLRAYALCLSKMLFLKQDTENFHYFKEFDLQFHSKSFQEKQFDFIISDYGFPEFRNLGQMDKGFHRNRWHYLNSKYNEKLVLLGSFNLFIQIKRHFTKSPYYNDLEAIIRLPIDSSIKKEYVFVMNKKKNDKSMGKFLLIDETEDSIKYSSSKFPKKILNRIIKQYRKFEGYDKGKVILLSEVGDFFSILHLISEKKITFEDDNPIYYLGELVDMEESLRTMKEHIEDYDLFFIPLTEPNMEKHIHYTFDYFNDEGKYLVKPVVLNLKSGKILKDYLYYFLNSNKGKHILSFFTEEFVKDFKYSIIKEDLFYVPVPVPTIEEQEKIVEVARNMDEFFNAMDIWKRDYSNNILNYNPALESYKNFTCSIEFNEAKEFCKNWRIVYNGLAWPLAYSYLKATKGSNDNSIKKKNYLVLFEFLAAFNVTVMISGIKEYIVNDEEYDEIMEYLWELYHGNLRTWHTMHFGGWTTLYSRLTKIYKKYSFSTEFDKDFLFDLSQKKYKNLFHKLRDKERNPEAHSGLEDEIDVNIKMHDLEVYMNDDIFSILKIYSGFKFYYVVSGTDISPNKKSYEVYILNGPCDYPHMDDLITDKKLDSQCLYFYNPLNDAFLKIDSDLMKFRIIPGTKQYAIYIFNKIEIKNNVAIYRAFHIKEEVWEIPLKTDEDTYFKASDSFLKNVLRLDDL